MEDMNVTEMVDNTMEVPATVAETGETKGNVLATVIGVGGVIALWEGAKWLGKKIAAGVKKVFKHAAKAEETKPEEETVEEETVDND